MELKLTAVSSIGPVPPLLATCTDTALFALHNILIPLINFVVFLELCGKGLISVYMVFLFVICHGRSLSSFFPSVTSGLDFSAFLTGSDHSLPVSPGAPLLRVVVSLPRSGWE